MLLFASAAYAQGVPIGATGCVPVTTVQNGVPTALWVNTADGGLCVHSTNGGGGGGGAVFIQPSASSTYGITPALANNVSNIVAKASPGNLYGFYVTNPTGAGYLYVFNSTTLPSNGAVTAGVASGNYEECIGPVSAGGSSYALSYFPGPPEIYTVGITVAYSSTACGTFTAASVGTSGVIHASYY